MTSWPTIERRVHKGRLAGLIRLGTVVLALAVPAAAAGQQKPAPAGQPPASTPSTDQDLAKKLSNPVSDLVSIPFQFNWQQNVGPDDATQFILNVEPVMPFSISQHWNLIARVILPVMGQPAFEDGGTPTFGFGDVLASFFLSPSQGGITWGVGPAISLPSTQIPALGSGKWSAGPTAVVLNQTGPWTIGALWRQIWSFSGNTTREDVNQMFLQPFFSYQATPTVTLTLQSETTANWEVDDDRWTVPVNVIVAKLASLGTIRASYQFSGGVFVEHPDTGPTWKIRSAVVLLLPRSR